MLKSSRPRAPAASARTTRHATRDANCVVCEAPPTPAEKDATVTNPLKREAPASGQAEKSSMWVLLGLSLTMLLSSLGTSIANVALPTFAKAFSASFQDVQWVVLAYLLAVTALIVSVGRLGDIVGRRRLMLTGVALFTVASVLCGVATELWFLIGARVAQGLGAAAMMALTMAFVGEAVPKEKTGRAMGLLGTMSAVGTALGPTLGGVIISGLGWRAIFILNLPLGVAAFLLAYRFLPADQSGAGSRRGFNVAGSLLLVLTLTAYALSMTLGRGHFGALNLLLLCSAAVGLGLFVVAQKSVAAPLIQLSIFRSPVLSTGFATSALVTTVVMATLVVGPFYLARALGLDPARVGLVMSVGPVVAALSGVPAGHLVDRFGAYRMSLSGLIAMALGSALLPLLPARLGIPGYVAPLVVITAGYALFQAANNTAVMASIRADQRGVVSGVLNLSRNLGLVTGASVMGAVFTLGSGAANVSIAGPAAVAAGMRMTFVVGAFLMLVAIAIALFGRSRSQRQAAQVQ